MKLPNGYGTVKKLSGKRRKPYMVQKTTGWTVVEESKTKIQKRIVIGYYVTRAEALQALAAYNDNPYDLSVREITLRQMVEKWAERRYKKVRERTQECYNAATKSLEPILDRPIREIKAAELQALFDNSPLSSSSKANIKVVLRGAYEYAMQNDIIDKDYSQFIEIGYSESLEERIPYTHEEIAELWKLSDQYDVQVILILLYSGMRVNELLEMPRECCHIDEKYLDILKAKNKTSIRRVPIHDKVFGFVKEFYDRNGTNLITKEGGFKVPYNNFVARNLKSLNEKLGMKHRMHDTRHTFITEGKRCRMDPLYLKRIVGHSPDNITEAIYTHLTVADLLPEINKLKY